MNRLLVNVILIILLTTFSKISTSKETLTTSYYMQYLPPEYFIDEDMNVVGGIIFDITQELAHRANVKAAFIQIPRKRIEQALLDQTIDIYCNANPAWYRDESLLWSLPLYTTVEVLINRKNLASLDELARQQEMKIGTTLGYIYPDLITLFENKNLTRVDQINPLSHWLAYQKENIDGFVMSKLGAEHLGAIEGSSAIEFDYSEISCAFSPNISPSFYNQLVDILEEMRHSGKIKSIIEYNKSIRKGWVNPTHFVK